MMKQCSLFDDNNLGEFIDRTASEIGMASATIPELNKLRDLLNKYNEKETDAEIINDPTWKKIAEQARIVIEEWNKV